MERRSFGREFEVWTNNFEIIEPCLLSIPRNFSTYRHSTTVTYHVPCTTRRRPWPDCKLVYPWSWLGGSLASDRHWASHRVRQLISNSCITNYVAPIPKFSKFLTDDSASKEIQMWHRIQVGLTKLKFFKSLESYFSAHRFGSFAIFQNTVKYIIHSKRQR